MGRKAAAEHSLPQQQSKIGLGGRQCAAAQASPPTLHLGDVVARIAEWEALREQVEEQHTRAPHIGLDAAHAQDALGCAAVQRGRVEINSSAGPVLQAGTCDFWYISSPQCANNAACVPKLQGPAQAPRPTCTAACRRTCGCWAEGPGCCGSSRDRPAPPRVGRWLPRGAPAEGWGKRGRGGRGEQGGKAGALGSRHVWQPHAWHALKQAKLHVHPAAHMPPGCRRRSPGSGA